MTYNNLVNELSKIAVELNKESDELCENIRHSNEQLNKLNIGIEVWIIIKDSTLKLGYGKGENHNWGLLIESKDKKYYFNDAPRQCRIDVIESIPELLKAIMHESRILLIKVKKAKDFIKSLPEF